MDNQDFTFSFTSSRNAGKVFNYLLNPRNWWVGFYGENIAGKNTEINDEFSFRAGGGAHYSNQKLTALEPGRKIAWLVTESNLSFLKNTNEWAGTTICFDIEQEGDNTRVTFRHQGLVPEIECYGSCTSGWTKYMHQLAENLR